MYILALFLTKKEMTKSNKQKDINQIVNKHPLKEKLVNAVLESWNSIFDSKIGKLTIGKDIFPQPQIMGFFLHELIPVYLSKENKNYCRGDANSEKDIHCKTNIDLGIEIKTSSDKSKIFGNRSYAQPSTNGKKKNKNGYYLAINFEKFTTQTTHPEILLIRFGYLEQTDWIAQDSPTGQQARLGSDTYNKKFVVLYKKQS